MSRLSKTGPSEAEIWKIQTKNKSRVLCKRQKKRNQI